MRVLQGQYWYVVGLLFAQSNQSAGPVRFLIFCSISIFLLASLVAGRRHQCNAGAVQQGMYSTIPIHWNIKSAPASPGRSRVGPAFYVFSFLGCLYRTQCTQLQRTVLYTTTVHTQEAKYVERWPSTTSAWADWSRFDVAVDRYGGVHSLLRWPSRPPVSLTCH